MDKKCRIAIFASGEGSNAEAIVRYFSNHSTMEVMMVISNNEKAGVHRRMQKWNIPCFTIEKSEWQPDSTGYVALELMRSKGIDMIVLAGFLAYIPANIVTEFKGRIVNIHPSLLPKYGGKGMWGHHVHEAVIAARETMSGITIHHVTEKLDDGSIIFQAECEVLPADTPDSLTARIHRLEYEHYPRIVEQLGMKLQ
ncbi:MAG: phosphoribosylglycinamide formyltransferase [Bacteroidaceae bacterium]|nr:phosphoribosylglycinamide formyltransferase [Bacteroidaceae bacterium]